MVFNATFNNISVISWPSVLLVEETQKCDTMLPIYGIPILSILIIGSQTAIQMIKIIKTCTD
jgi:hypothetical protein